MWFERLSHSTVIYICKIIPLPHPLPPKKKKRKKKEKK